MRQQSVNFRRITGNADRDQSREGLVVAADQTKHRRTAGARVMVGVNADGTGGKLIWAVVQTIRSRTHELVREANVNAADDDLHLFDCTPSDFCAPSTLTAPKPGDLWSYSGVVYQLLHCPPPDQLGSVPVAQIVWGFRQPPTPAATEPAGATTREVFWPPATTIGD